MNGEKIKVCFFHSTKAILYSIFQIKNSPNSFLNLKSILTQLLHNCLQKNLQNRIPLT